MTKRAQIAAILIAMASPAWAEDIAVSGAFSYETAAMAQAAGGYLQITNTSDTDDILLAAEADFPRVMIHDTVVEDGVAKMQHLMSLPIPAGETVTLEPGGTHVMFMGLSGAPFTEGDTIPATLVFENAGRVDVTFEVVARPR